MSEEEKKAIDWLSALDIKSEYEATNKEMILNLIENKDKTIELMAKEILRLDTEKSKYEYDHAKMWDTENGIKEYFIKKGEE